MNSFRNYNNALALASVGCHIEQMPRGGWTPMFKIGGKLHHLIGALFPVEGESPKFAQLFFHDVENEVANRLRHNPDLDRVALEQLQAYLRAVNRLVQSLEWAAQFRLDPAMELPDGGGAGNPDVQVVIQADKRPTTEHARRYNMPTASEVAVILPGDQSHHLSVVIQTRGGPLMQIPRMHRSYDPLCYPLLFP
ncbi:MAG: hypothetical protein GY696_34455, partial [Gammaproteobacteria bacterium]|nr:hypothetical protein [Gammaproteobacteria bacterium]